MKATLEGLDNYNVGYLSIQNTTLRDNGIYTCKVADNQDHHTNASIKVKIYGTFQYFVINYHNYYLIFLDKDEYFIKVEEPNGNYHIVTYAGKDMVLWVVDVDGHPKPSLKW